MKKSLLLIMALGLLVSVASSCGGGANSSEDEAAAAAAQQARLDSLKQIDVMAQLQTLPEEPVFDMVTSLGTIRIKLYSGTPKHRENFAKLALSGYYDGLLFHRVINGFMIQGGDPLTRNPENAPKYGTGGPDYTVPAEFVPEYVHKKGAIAAARRGDAANPMKASSGSQFYLVQNEQSCAQLDGEYTVFGETIEGFEVIDKIAEVETNGRDCPVQDVQIISVNLAQ